MSKLGKFEANKTKFDQHLVVLKLLIHIFAELVFVNTTLKDILTALECEESANSLVLLVFQIDFYANERKMAKMKDSCR